MVFPVLQNAAASCLSLIHIYNTVKTWTVIMHESGNAEIGKRESILEEDVYKRQELGIATIQNLKVASFKRTAPIAAAPVHNSKIKAEDSRPGRIWILEH